VHDQQGRRAADRPHGPRPLQTDPRREPVVGHPRLPHVPALVRFDPRVAGRRRDDDRPVDGPPDAGTARTLPAPVPEEPEGGDRVAECPTVAVRLMSTARVSRSHRLVVETHFRLPRACPCGEPLSWDQASWEKGTSRRPGALRPTTTP